LVQSQISAKSRGLNLWQKFAKTMWQIATLLVSVPSYNAVCKGFLREEQGYKEEDNKFSFHLV